MSNWKVPPKTFTQEQLYLAGYRIEYTPICTYEARTSSGKTLAISRDVDDCWQACWEDHQENQQDWKSEAIARAAILENTVLVAQEHGYQNNSWIGSIHYLDEQLKEAKAMEARAIAVWDQVPPDAEWIVRHILGYDPRDEQEDK